MGSVKTEELIEAIEKEDVNVEKISALLKRMKINSVNARDVMDLTPLHYACMKNKAEVVSMLLAVPGIKVNTKADAIEDEMTPIMCAANPCNVESLRVMLKDRVDLDILDFMGKGLEEKTGEIVQLLGRSVGGRKNKKKFSQDENKSMQSYLESAKADRLVCLDLIKKTRKRRADQAQACIELKEEINAKASLDKDLEGLQANVRDQIEKVHENMEIRKESLRKKEEILEKEMQDLKERQDLEKKEIKEKFDYEIKELEQKILVVKQKNQEENKKTNKKHRKQRQTLKTRLSKDVEDDKNSRDKLKETIDTLVKDNCRIERKGSELVLQRNFIVF